MQIYGKASVEIWGGLLEGLEGIQHLSACLWAFCLATYVLKGVTHLPNSVWRPDWLVDCLPAYVSIQAFCGSPGAEIVCLSDEAVRRQGFNLACLAGGVSASIVLPFLPLKMMSVCPHISSACLQDSERTRLSFITQHNYLDSERGDLHRCLVICAPRQTQGNKKGEGCTVECSRHGAYVYQYSQSSS